MDDPHPALPAVALPADTRVGDRERALTCDQLSAHYAAGRLGPDELEVRLEAAMTAPTAGALQVLLRDLPDLGPRASGPASPSPRTGPAALDLLALACVVGALGIAVSLVLSLVVTGGGWVLAAGLVGGTVAAAGGGGAVHLAHRAWSRSVERAAQNQRPRIA